MILLHTTKYGESSLVLHCYSEDEGRCSLLLRNIAGRRKGKATTALLHPLSVLNCEITGSANGKMPCVREYSARYNLHSIRTEFTKSAAAMFIGELLYRTLLHSERDESLYRFIETSILGLEQSGGNTANFPLWFTIQYAALLGFPVRCEGNGTYPVFSPGHETAIGRICGCSCMEEALGIPMTGEFRSELTSEILKYLEYHTGNRIEIKSVSVLHQILKT